MTYFDKIQEKMAIQIRQYLEELKDREKPRELSKDSMKKLNEWVERVKPIDNAERIFAQHIRGNGVWKKLVVLQSISLPNPFHIIAIGDPASGKSEVCQSIQGVTPTTRYVWATKMSAAGLTLSRMGDELAKGELPECHMGQLFVDEFDKAPAQESGALLGSMQHGWFGIAKASLKVPYVPANAAICAMANPKGDYWQSAHPDMIRQQLPFNSQALLTRFHVIVILRRPEVKEFQEISMHQLESSMRGMPENKFDKDDENMWQLYVNYLRKIKVNEWENPEKQRKAVSAFTRSAYEQDLKFQLAIPISPRLNTGIERIAMAYAKSRLESNVHVKDTVRALQLVADTLIPCGLNVERAMKAVKKNSGVEIGAE